MASNLDSGVGFASSLVPLGTPASPQSTLTFEGMPLDVQRIIMDNVSRQDILNMARVKALSSAARLCLYTTVSLRLAQHEGFIEDLNRFKAAGWHNLALVQNISILNSKRRRRDPRTGQVLPHYRFNRFGNWVGKDLWTTNSEVFNQEIRSLLVNIPNLRSVRWFHVFKMSHETFAAIFTAHINTLSSLETNTLTGSEVAILPWRPNLVQSLPLSIGLHNLKIVGRNGTLNSSLLNFLTRLAPRFDHLVLGDELLLHTLDDAWGGRPHRVYEKPSVGDVLRLLAGATNTLENLSKLDVIGMEVARAPNQQATDAALTLMSLQEIHGSAIDVTLFLDQGVPLRPTIDLYNLRRLSLISCTGTEGLLTVLSLPAPHTTLPYVQTRMRLKEFCIRHEFRQRGIKTALENFLLSFRGLELLSILLDGVTCRINPIEVPNHEMFMDVHGPTLKVLVWEIRKHQGNTPVDVEDSISGESSFLEYLSETCPNLQELGLVLNMKLLHRRGLAMRRIASHTPYSMLRLPHLKTLHCRDIFITQGRLSTPGFIVNATKSIATAFLDWGFHIHGGASSLELLAVGPMHTRDRWIQNHIRQDYTHRPEAGPIFYDVRTYPDNLTGVSHLLNPLLKTRQPNGEIVLDEVENIRQHYKYTRVFDSYWLR
ncbi:hypothetical protein PAAG_03609 [Paracoccidioides lutzii Pb01]|uniref:Uncharacterized protein n=1 Tax=Paracoccidioides lutzii (strain ATCC MYA-826 / Pb01) TaxID=502779 RepID=C1GXN5_PARBA|nr:hypothetical protein PAAG_03609 [Paracoccidioides lutzii Pb01]EEH41323.1 hypothetical protein PAAG_03609 [Paracoccidioides lutzii Pb01]